MTLELLQQCLPVIRTFMKLKQQMEAKRFFLKFKFHIFKSIVYILLFFIDITQHLKH